MTTSIVINDSILYFATLLKEFNFVKPFIYDPELSFSRINNNIVRKGLPDFKDDKMSPILPNDWVIIHWNRSNISLLNQNPRINQVINFPGDKKSVDPTLLAYKLSTVTVFLSLIINHVDYAERLEELIQIRSKTFTNFKSTFKDLGEFTISIDDFEISSWDKLSHDKFGPLIGIPITYKLNYIIFDNPENANIIREINAETYSTLYGERVKDKFILLNKIQIKA